MGGIGRAFNILHCHTATLPTLPNCYRLTYLYTATHTKVTKHTHHTHTHTYIIYNKTSKKDKQKDKQGMAWHDTGDNDLNSWDFSFSKSAICFHHLTYLCAGNDRVSSYTQCVCGGNSRECRVPDFLENPYLHGPATCV